MKKNILIVCALPLEMKIIKQEVKKLKFNNLNIKFLLTGAGNYETIHNLSNHLLNNTYDFILNIGVCGLANNFISKDIFQVYRIKNVSNSREIISPIYLKLFPLKSILSSEKIIISEMEMLGEEYVDMESYGIDFVCTKMKLSYISVKIPFDIVNVKSKKVDLKILEEVIKKLDYNYILENINTYLENNIVDNSEEESELEKYKNIFKFSFSENLIFIKNYNKFKALNYDFKEFYENNKLLSKKEFLEKIKNYY